MEDPEGLTWGSDLPATHRFGGDAIYLKAPRPRRDEYDEYRIAGSKTLSWGRRSTTAATRRSLGHRLEDTRLTRSLEDKGAT